MTMLYVISEKTGAAYWREGDYIFCAPVWVEGAFNTEERAEVETWEDIAPSEKKRIENLLGF